MRPRRFFLALGVVALTFTACQFAVTPDGSAYHYTDANGVLTVHAPSTSGDNERQFFWSSDGASESDASACATFSGGRGIDQPGIALRIADGGNRAVTVTENIYPEMAFNQFNFHVWNTANSPAFTQFAAVTLPVLPIYPATYPLNMCARITGDVMQFVVWTTGTQPAWGDPTWGGQATLPRTAPTAGLSGFYAGHLTPDTSLTYSKLTVDGQANDPAS